MSRLHHRSKSGTSTDVDVSAPTLPPISSVPATLRLRKRGMTGVRRWLLLDSDGQAHLMEAEKHAIMRRTGLPATDLRILDPLLSYPSTILGRERAIVVSLEHVKAIITANEVLMLHSRNPAVIVFVDELQGELSRRSQASKAMKAKEGKAEGSKWCDLEEAEEHLRGDGASGDEGGEARGPQGHPEKNGKEMKVLPFEFVALEVCLEVACTCLENEARTVELEAHPALDKLISKFSKPNIEHVRQIKSRLVAITSRVQKVRDELENLLNDDDDMAEMYLTENSHLENSTNASSSAVGDDTNDEAPQTVADDTHDSNLAEISPDATEESINFEGDIWNSDNPGHKFNEIHRTHTSSTRSTITRKSIDVKELEMLLEAYLVQIEGISNKLSMLDEYIEDTEDYMQITLDDKQNRLYQMVVMLSTASLIISAFIEVTGVFGMQIHIDLFDDTKAGMNEFLWVVGGCTMVSVVLYIISIGWFKKKRLLD